MITKIRLANWRSHLDSELDFSLGTNALLGHMGSGKTSILDSICFGLFGTFPNLQSKKLKLDDIIMKRPIEKSRAEVEAQFQSGGKTYSVKRVIEKGKGTAYSEIREEGKLLEAPNASRVTEIVEKILKVNYELFSKAIYSEQNALDLFLTIAKGQRMKKIDELLMIDRFEKTRANTVVLTNKIVERKLGKQSIVEQVNVEELEKIIGELKTSFEKTKEEKLLLEKILTEIIAERQTLETEVTQLQKVRENLEILKREENGITSAIQETSLSLESLERMLKDVNKESIEKNLNFFSKLIKEFEDLLIEKQKEYQKLQEQTSKAKAEVEFLRKEKIERLEKELDEKLKIKKEFDRIKKSLGEDTEKDLEEKRHLLEKFVGEVESIRIKLQDLLDLIDQLSSIKAKCPICESKLTEARKIVLIKQKKVQVAILKESLDKASKNKQLTERELRELEFAANRLSQMVVEIKDFDEIKTELENSKNIYSVLNESAVKLEKELSALRIEMQDLQNKLKDVTDKKQQFQILNLQLHDYIVKKSRIDELFQQRNNFVRHIEELEKNLIGKDFVRLELQLRNSLAKEREVTTKILGIDQISKEKEIRLKDFEQTMNNAVKEKEEIKRLDKLIKELKVFEKALEETQIELRKEFVTAVNYTMNQLWNTLYPYQDFTGIKLSIDEGDYVLQLQTQSREWVNVEGVVSGGERAIACLALRIAFALVLAPQLRIAILDEPTHNLDSKALSELAITLRERVGEFLDQVFIISHNPEIEDAITGNAYRLERDKTKDEVTKVIQLT